MPEALEIAIHILEHGITTVTLLAILNVVLTWYESRRKRKAYQRMELKIDAITMAMGVQPCADTLTLITQLSVRTPRDGYTSLRLEELRALYAARKVIWLFIIWNIRRVVKMQINKTWLAAVIIYLLAIIGKKTGMTFTDELANQIADVALTLILPLIMALLSHRKGKADEKRPVDTGSAV